MKIGSHIAASLTVAVATAGLVAAPAQAAPTHTKTYAASDYDVAAQMCREGQASFPTGSFSRISRSCYFDGYDSNTPRNAVWAFDWVERTS